MLRPSRSLHVGTIALALLGACSGHRGERAAVYGVSDAELQKGRLVFAQECAACHGSQGRGAQIGPKLTDERARKSFEQVRAIVADPAPPMPKLYPSRLTQGEVRDVSAYVETLQ